MEEIKLSQEEIEVLTKLQDTQSNIISTLGQLEYNIQLLELQKESLTEHSKNQK
jgi:nicotinic acid phosphoribosyltransferase